MEQVVGIDFGGPRRASAQRKKILAVAAERTGPRAYRVACEGLNTRLIATPPGWTAFELAEALISAPSISVVAPDFPFSLPRALLASPGFADGLGLAGPLADWPRFNALVAERLGLSGPVDFAPFAGWRRKEYWLKRSCDRATNAVPALKDRFQVLFNMTLLGAAFLRQLDASGKFDVRPFQNRGRAPVIEIYPGHAMRLLGVPNYKSRPGAAIAAAIRHLESSGIAFDVAPEIRAACELYDSGRSGTQDHDGADALVASAIAALYREGLAVEIRGEDPTAYLVEGAIWGPRILPPEG